MYLIALCDDEAAELDQIEQLLGQYQQTAAPGLLEYELRRFSSAEELLEQIETKDYTPDLLLLDIFLSGKTGIEAAERIRRSGGCMPIVFLTMSKEHALSAYEVDAIQYLVKPLEKKRFFHAMDTAFEQLQKIEKNQILLRMSGGIRRLRSDEIIYCESQKNYQMIYLKNEACRIRLTAGELWEMLRKSPQFGRCGRSFILNMNHILSIERSEICMDNGQTIYIPRNKAAEFKQIYFAYYFKEMDSS
ncbi:MAG: response regulator transcription factor [Lachnospiraceae bacterium]|nr:response regulator transcription factor [Lachnospiraceae bacterium]